MNRVKTIALIIFHIGFLAFPKDCKYLLGEIIHPKLSVEEQRAELHDYFGFRGFINSEAFSWSLALAFHKDSDRDTLFDRALDNFKPYPRSHKSVLAKFKNMKAQVAKLRLDPIQKGIVRELFNDKYNEKVEDFENALDLIYKKEPSWISRGMNYATLGTFSLLPFFPIIAMTFDQRSTGQDFGPAMGFMAISGIFGIWVGHYALQMINGNTEYVRNFPKIFPDISMLPAKIPRLIADKHYSVKDDSINNASTITYFKVIKRWPVLTEIMTPVILIKNSTPSTWLAVSAEDFDSALRFRNSLDIFLINQKNLNDTHNHNSTKSKAQVGNRDTLKKYSGSKVSVLITPKFRENLKDKDVITQRQMLKEYLLKEISVDLKID